MVSSISGVAFRRIKAGLRMPTSFGVVCAGLMDSKPGADCRVVSAVSSLSSITEGRPGKDDKNS